VTAAHQKGAAAHRRAEDLAIAVDLILRSVPAVDDLVRALHGAGGSARLVKALRAKLARVRRPTIRDRVVARPDPAVWEKAFLR
jgi:hypothetical protein